MIFFDEFDAIGKARGGPNSHEEREQTLNQLLVELDGFATTDDVIVIAATNRLDILDSAVLRPGRFNRKIHVGLPDVKGRRAILDVHARNKPLAGDDRPRGDSPARPTASRARCWPTCSTRRRSWPPGGAATRSTAEDLHAGWLKVAVGTSRRRSMDERERSIIAAHEVGHAICGKVHGDKRRVEEISPVRPRRGARRHGQQPGGQRPAVRVRPARPARRADGRPGRRGDPLPRGHRRRVERLRGGQPDRDDDGHEVGHGSRSRGHRRRHLRPRRRCRSSSPTGGTARCRPRSRPPRPARSGRSSTRRTPRRSQTLIANIDTLRRLAAYLVEHERVDGDDVRRAVRRAPAGPERRRTSGAPPTSRPRAWGEIVDLAAHRTRPAPVAQSPVAAVAAEPAPVAVTAAASVSPPIAGPPPASATTYPAASRRAGGAVGSFAGGVVQALRRSPRPRSRPGHTQRAEARVTPSPVCSIERRPGCARARPRAASSSPLASSMNMRNHSTVRQTILHFRGEEEALAALPGGTGPGALDGASDTTNRGLQGTEAPGAAAPRSVTAVFLCPASRPAAPHHTEGTTTCTRCHPRRRPPRPCGRDRRCAIAGTGTAARPRPPGRRRHDPAAISAGHDLVVDASRGDAVADNVGAGARTPAVRPVRHRDDRLGRRPRPRRDAVRGPRRGRGRGVELQPRRRPVRAPRRGRRGAVRAGRGLRSVPRRVASPRRSATGRPGPPRTSPRRIVAGHPRLGDAPTTSRSCRSGPAHRRACTSSASTPPARRSSSG